MSKITYLPLPPLEVLRFLFILDKSSPSGLRWKNPSSSAVKPGDVAGSKNNQGYWSVKIKRRNYKCHRIIYYLNTEVDPIGLDIDHKFGNKQDNSEIRQATRIQNNRNVKKRKLHKGRPTTSKYKGVALITERNKWRAYIQHNAKRIHLGVFVSEVEAAKAYDAAALVYFGEFALTNRVLFPDDGL